MILFQIYFQSYQILVGVRQVGGPLHCHVVIPSLPHGGIDNVQGPQ